MESQTVIPVKQGQDHTLSGNLSTGPFTAALGNGAYSPRDLTDF